MGRLAGLTAERLARSATFPFTLPVKRADEVKAARELDVNFKKG